MLVGIFEEQVRKYPDKVAVQSKDSGLTYAELNHQANQLGRSILDSGHNFLKDEPTIGLLFEHGVDMIVGMLGALKTGLPYTPMDSSYPEQRLAYMIDDSKTRVLVTNDNNLELAKDAALLSVKRPMIVNIDRLAQSFDGDNLNLEIDRDQIAYILYTSGSTGRPKGVIQSHANVRYFVDQFIDSFRLSNKDRLTLLSAFSHDAAVMDIYGGLLSGATLYPLDIREEVLLSDLDKWLEENQITVYHSVPSLFRVFMNSLDHKMDLPHLRQIILGGEGVRRNDIDLFQKYFAGEDILLANLYGQSESSLNSVLFIETDQKIERITLGEPVEGTEFIVIDEDWAEVKPLQTGEIVVASEHVAKGYWDNQDKTEEVFIDDPDLGRMYLTGDMGRLMLDGTVEFMGRKDNQVKVRGYRVELGEIESQINSYQGVEDTVVLTKLDPGGNTYLVGYLVSDEEVVETELKDYLADRLPAYMVPTLFVQLDTFPKTRTNKVDRQALPEPEFGSKDEKFISPRNQIEEKIASIWTDVLGMALEKISIKSSFFELGGNSLSLMNLAARLSREFETNLQIGQLYNNLTVEQMATLMESSTNDGGIIPEIKQLPKADWYPASSAQKRIYILNQIENKSTAYNLPIVVEIQGSMDQGQFEGAVQQLIQRHEALRTSFHQIDGQLKQRVDDQVEFNVEKYNLEERAPKDEIVEIVKDFIRPFNLKRAPLFRVGLIQWGSDQILIFDSYHIISDGTSNDILIREFLKLYAGQKLEPLSYQYKDYADWQERLLSGEMGEELERYWLNQFRPELTGCEIPILNLPTDYPRPVQQQFSGEQLHFEINRELTIKLEELAHKTDSTLYMVLLSIYSLLLAKYSGQEDIIIGSPVAGRSQREFQGIVGMFVNTLALRTHPEGFKSFLGYLDEVKELTIGALEHQEYPFEELINRLDLERDPGRNPLFDVNFRLQNFRSQEVVLSDITASPFEYDNPISQFDLQLTCLEWDDGIRCDLEYATSLFKRRTIERISQHFIQLIEKVVKNPEERLADFQLVTPEEKDLLLEKWNDTQIPYKEDMTIHQLFEAQVEKRGDEVALIADGESLTYQRLNQRANQLARKLRQNGIKGETIVGLMVERTVDVIVGMLAILKAGGAYLPIDPEYPRERIRYVLEDSQAQLLLTQHTLEKKVDYSGDIIYLDDGEHYQGDGSNLDNINQASDLIYLIYTSGSTGKPKGTMLEHASVHNFIVGMRQLIDFRPGKVIASLTTVSFDIYVLESLLPLVMGMKVVLATEREQSDPTLFEDLMMKHGVEMIQMTPSRLHILLEHGLERVLGQMEEIMVGGEAFPERLIQSPGRLAETRIYNMYGPTETTVWSTVAELTDAQEVTIGRPIANTRVYVLDRHLNLVPPQVSGQLYIGGHGLSRGYLGLEELTEERFIDDPFRPGEKIYKTGDLVRWLPDGRLDYIGRTDHQVKIRGYRIEIGEIEVLMEQLPTIKENVVVAKEGDDGFKYLACYYVAEEEISVSQIRQNLLEDLPAYMVPDHYYRLDALPLTPNGKVDRNGLPDLADYNPHLDNQYQEPETRTQKLIADLWSQVLNIEKIGIHDNFFDLGGNSMRLIQLHQELEKKMPGQIATVDLFAYPTIARLSSFIEDSRQEVAVSREVEDYWNQELGQRPNLLTLPPDYYQDELGQGQSYNLRFQLDDKTQTGLKKISSDLEIDLIDITTALYIYLLKEVSGLDEIVIEVGSKDDPGQVFPLKVNFAGIKDLIHIFKQVHRKYIDGHKRFHDSLHGHIRKGLAPEKVIPLFTQGSDTHQKDNDLALILKREKMTFVCEYDSSKLKGEKVEELVNGYLELIEMLIQQYQTVK